MWFTELIVSILCTALPFHSLPLTNSRSFNTPPRFNKDVSADYKTVSFFVLLKESTQDENCLYALT